MDLHTTNGSYHGYVLTWSPGLNPNPTPANTWVRDTLLPVVRDRDKRPAARIEAQQQRQHCGLAAPGVADDAHKTASGYVDAYVVQYRLLRV